MVGPPSNKRVSYLVSQLTVRRLHARSTVQVEEGHRLFRYGEVRPVESVLCEQYKI